MWNKENVQQWLKICKNCAYVVTSLHYAPSSVSQLKVNDKYNRRSSRNDLQKIIGNVWELNNLYLKSKTFFKMLDLHLRRVELISRFVS